MASDTAKAAEKAAKALAKYYHIDAAKVANLMMKNGLTKAGMEKTKKTLQEMNAKNFDGILKECKLTL